MKVCAEYEDQIAAFTAHRSILDQGADPEDIELRSPYPLSEHPIPPHRSKPMIVRNVVRVFWLLGLIGGFAFITFTQWEWGLTAKTGGQPLVAIPINSIIMYECGMITAILVTTLMFFVETRRYRQLVPALEEDMVVANGYIALVVSGESAKKAKKWLEETNARSVVSYILPLAFTAFLLNGCSGTFIGTTRWDNLRQQSVYKPGEVPADLPPPYSLRMPTVAEQEVVPEQPLGWMYYGDPIEFERAEAEFKTLETEYEAKVKSNEMKRKDVNKILRDKRLELDELKPEILLYKSGVPTEVRDAKNPVAYDDASKKRGAELYKVNCSQCHGLTGNGEGGVGAKWGGPDVVPHIGDASKYGDTGRYPDGFFYHNIIVGKNLMPSFGYKLTTHEVWDIVNYVRELQGK
jgi:mono/diheme cytochrome c family protein